MTTASLMAWVPILVVLFASGAIWISASGSRCVDDTHARWLGAMGLIGATAASLVLWPRGASVYSGFAVDHYALFFNMLLCAAVLFWLTITRSGEQGPRRWALILLSVAAAMVAAAALDLVVMVTAIQAVSIGTALLIASHSRESGVRLAAREFVPAVVCGTVALYGVALVYALTGTTRIDDAMMRVAASSLEPNGVMMIALALILAGLAWAAVVVPSRAWVAGGGAVGVMGLVAMFSAAAVLMRLMLTTFEPVRPDWQPVVAAFAAMLMIIGSVGAAGQTGVRRVAAYLTIAQVGLVLAGVVAGGESGRSAVLFSLVAHGLVSLAIGGAVTALLATAVPEDDLWDVTGLGYTRPVLAGLVAAGLLLLGGLPPGGGFHARWMVVQGAIAEGQRTVGLAAAVTGGVSMLVCLRLVVRLYRRGSTSARGPVREDRRMVVAVAVAVVLALLAGVMSGRLMPVVRAAGGPLF